MDFTILQLDDEQVDHLRFECIKIQRRRMQHILEVIKDLTFKNQELIKQNIKLKEQVEEERCISLSFEDIAVERKLFVQKNLLLQDLLIRYKETMLPQQMLINRLEQWLGYNNGRKDYAKRNYFTEPNFAKHIKSQYQSQEQLITSQDFQILRAQYQNLQKQYSKLFQSHYPSKKKIQKPQDTFTQRKKSKIFKSR